MTKIGIILNPIKDEGGHKTEKVIDGLLKRNIEPLVSPNIYSTFRKGKPTKSSELYKSSDIIITLGGDGTILSSAREAALYGKPLLGINLGRLGFLTEVEFANYESALDALLYGSYRLEKRMMIQALVHRKGEVVNKSIALNDMVIGKASFAHIIHLSAYIDNGFVDDYSADGFLVSTPTGSTAYSLSVGGPIINPTLECMVLAPICPHALNSRPIITNADSIISIRNNDKGEDVMLTADGQEEIALHDGDIIEISKSTCITKLIRIKDYHFFDLISEKFSTRL